MVDFRRMIPVLAVVAFLLGTAVTASAQGVVPFTCATTAIPFAVRSEGVTEPLGDYLLNCTGGTPTPPGGAVPQANIQVTLNVAMTSRLLGTVAGSVMQETLLLLDEPAVDAQFGCASNTGCVGYGNGLGTANAPSLVGYYGAGTPGSAVTGCALATCPGNNKNVFQGQQVLGGFGTIFIGVPIDPPGTSGNRVIRITNMRGNASALGATGSGFLNPVQAQLIVTSSQFISVPNPIQTLAFIQRGLVFSSSAAGAFQQCVSRGTGATNVASLRYTEGFPTAFKKRISTSNSGNPSSPNVGGGNTASFQNLNLPANQGTSPVSQFNNESMFINPALTLVTSPSGGQTVSPNNTPGLADFGTRIKAVFNNIPNGTNIFVATDAIFVGTGTACVLSTTTASNVFTSCSDHFKLTTGGEAGAFSAATGSAAPGSSTVGQSTQLTVVNNSATAVWEDLDSDPNTSAIINIPVWITYTANPGATPPVPSLSSTTVNGSFAPISASSVATSGPIPRFVDTSSAAVIFTIVPCVTNLLFPFVTSQSGFDTGLAISNTSSDPFKTPQQTGDCTLNWFGSAFTGATAVTPNVLPGTSFVALTSTVLSSVTGGFTGYMIAVCRFQYAHGFAFVSDLGARNLAMGYLALIIPDPPRTANPFPFSATGSGEQLGY